MTPLQEFKKIETGAEAIRFAKRVSTGAIKSPLTKGEWLRLIELQSEANSNPALSKQQNFAKYLDSEVGKELLWAMKATPADGIAAAADRHANFLKSAENLDGDDYLAKRAELDGENHARLHSMAIDMQRAKPGLSYQRAFSTVYTDPKNKKIADGAKDEHLTRAIASTMGGNTEYQAEQDKPYTNPHPTRAGSPRASSGTRT